MTGPAWFLSTYEAFAHVIDSMFNQHAKWLSICNQLPWRQNIASLNLLITSTVWRQDHNGFTHQDPGFLDVVVNKRAEVTRIYLPPDVNCSAVRRRSLSAQRELHQRDRQRQANAPAVSGHGCSDHALHERHQYLGSGQQRSRSWNRT